MTIGLGAPVRDSAELMHFGVKGMRWGVRNANGDKLDAQGARQIKRSEKAEHKAWKKNAMSTETANKAFQDAVKTYEPVVKKINNDPAFKDKDLTKDRRLAQQYDAVVSTVFNQHLADASVNLTYNAKTDRAVIYQFDRGLGMMRATEMKRVQHSDDDWVEEFPDFRATLDELGHILGFELIPLEANSVLEQSALTFADEQFLMHFGVKGMKWGVRRAAKKAWVGDPDKSGVTRQDKRIAVRKEYRKANNKLEDIEDGTRRDRTAAIKAARVELKQANRDFRAAKDTYKTEKAIIGKNAAKIELEKARVKKLTVRKLAEAETDGEAAVRIAVEVGTAVMKDVYATRKERKEAPERERQAYNSQWKKNQGPRRG